MNMLSDRSTPAQKQSETSNDYRSRVDSHFQSTNHDHDRTELPDEQLQRIQSRIERPQSLAGEIVFLVILCSTQLLTQAGLAQSIIIQHIIARSFGSEDQQGKLNWFSAAYSLTVGTFILIAGRLGDVFGHKRFIVGGFVWFGIWSALAGFAAYSGLIFFAFCRAMQGIGPAFLLPNAVAIIARSYEPGSRQNIIFGLFGATAPGGFLIGALFASLLSELVWWPWSYWILCLACLLLAVLAVFMLPVTPASNAKEQIKSNIWQRVDIFGSVLGVCSLILFNFAWNQGPVVGWSTSYTYSIMIAGIVLFVIFIILEKRTRHPLIPFGVLKIDAVFTLACITAGWSSFGIFVLYGVEFLQILRELTPLLTSAQFIPVAISGLIAAVTTGLSLSRLRASTVMLMAMAAFMTGGILFATMPVSQTYWAQTFVGIVILPWGMDMSFPAATIILSNALPQQHQGLAASLVTTFVNYSISIGLGIAGTVSSHVDDRGLDILQGYRGAFYVGVGLAGLGVVVASVFSFVERYRSAASQDAAKEADQV